MFCNYFLILIIFNSFLINPGTAAWWPVLGQMHFITSLCVSAILLVFPPLQIQFLITYLLQEKHFAAIKYHKMWR